MKHQNSLQKTQLDILQTMNPGMSYSDFTNKYAVTTWSEWEDCKFSDVLFYQPTSGSTSKRKWIPYTKTFIQQLDRAIAPWLYDLYQAQPTIAHGVHYWSLSWLPDELRGKASNDDTEKLSWAKRIVFKTIMAVPSSVQLAKSSKASQFATLCWLTSRADLTFISIWSPTYLLSLLSLFERHRQEIANTLESGEWSIFKNELQQVECPRSSRAAKSMMQHDHIKILVQELWPKLSVISCWTSADAKIWTEKLQQIFPDCKIHPKGLFATEGVVSIPFRKRLVLAYRSHFYEFKLEDGQVIPSWELKMGMKVSPIITGSHGLIRYHLQDWMMVDGFEGEIPQLSFLGREATVDLVGEKLDYLSARKVLAQYRQPALCLLANCNREQTPFYTVLVDSNSNEFETDEELDQLLSEYHHYRVARELGQLAPAHRLGLKDIDQFLYQLEMQSPLTFGDQKLETIIRVQNLQELVHAITS